MKIKNKMQEKGITLIALVVTIIILLILVGVTLAQVSGNNGLFKRTKEAVDKYKSAQEDEEQSLEKLSTYLKDFSIVGDDSNISKDEKASVKIINLELEVINTSSIKVSATVEGNPTRVEYSINNGEEWIKDESKENQKYIHTFGNLELGSYFVRVRAYDENDKYSEAISKIITLSAVTTAEEPEVLNGETFISKGELKTGSMPNNGAISTTPLSAGESYEVKLGYTSGGTIATKTLEEQTQGDAKAEDIAEGKTAWVDGKQIEGTSNNIQILEKGKVVTNPINHGADPEITLSLKNSYIEEDNAYLLLTGYSCNHSEGAPYISLKGLMGNYIVGNSCKFKIWHGGGSSASDGMVVTIDYIVVKRGTF